MSVCRSVSRDPSKAQPRRVPFAFLRSSSIDGSLLSACAQPPCFFVPTMFASARFVTLVAAVALAGVHAGPYDGWKPHAYCNDLSQMESTKIEPLTTEQAALVQSLEQVQVRGRVRVRKWMPCTGQLHLTLTVSLCVSCSILSRSISSTPVCDRRSLLATAHAHRTRACFAGTRPSTTR